MPNTKSKADEQLEQQNQKFYLLECEISRLDKKVEESLMAGLRFKSRFDTMVDDLNYEKKRYAEQREKKEKAKRRRVEIFAYLFTGFMLGVLASLVAATTFLH